MKFSPPPPDNAPSSRALAVYRRGTLVLVLRDAAGPIWPAVSSPTPVTRHAGLRGRFLTLDHQRPLLEMLGRAQSAEELVRLLEGAGFEARWTPAVVFPDVE